MVLLLAAHAVSDLLNPLLIQRDLQSTSIVCASIVMHCQTQSGRLHRDPPRPNRLIILLLLLAAHSSSSAERNHAYTSAESCEVAAFVQRLELLREDASIPGLSVAVVKDREIVLAAGLGLADIEEGIPATAETAYDIASVAKPLSAVVALRLAEAGALDLERPIANYSEWMGFCTTFSQQSSLFARELRCQPPDHTLRHLLSHTATIERDVEPGLLCRVGPCGPTHTL